MLDEILADATLRLATVTGHARRHVGLERDALLLAVIADVDAGVLLLVHDLGDRPVELVRHSLRIDRLSRLALDQQLGDRLVARQAADMRGQDAVAAHQHLRIPQEERAQLVACRLAYRKIEAVHNGKPEAAWRHRVLIGWLVLVEGDLHARHSRHPTHLVDERLRRMAIAWAVWAEQHDAIPVTAVAVPGIPTLMLVEARPRPATSPPRPGGALAGGARTAPRSSPPAGFPNC